MAKPGNMKVTWECPVCGQSGLVLVEFSTEPVLLPEHSTSAIVGRLVYEGIEDHVQQHVDEQRRVALGMPRL